MNESLFFIHIAVAICFILLACKRGKEALCALFALQVVLANLFVFKQITFAHLTITCTETLTIGSMLTLNVLQEAYGKKTARRAISTTFLLLIFFAAMATFHLLYRPSPFDTTHVAYMRILSHGPRVVFASLAVTFVVQHIDVALYGAFQKRMPESWVIPRTVGSLLITQLLDTVLFSFVGLYGLVANIWHIILASTLIKYVIIFSMAPFSAAAKRMRAT